MSRYLISDIHGDFSRFKNLLKKINFNYENDIMYILGDALDRGKENLALIDFIQNNDNIFMIKGNHELFAQMYLSGQLDREQWIAWGGEHTANEVDALNDKDKKLLNEFILNLDYYFEIDVDGERWILTHSGLDADCLVLSDGKVKVKESIEKAIEENKFKYLVSNDIHYLPYSKTKILDHFMVVGHTPVMRLNEDGSYRIIHRDKFMCIDSGAGHRKQGGKMSCYCIETADEFYL